MKDILFHLLNEGLEVCLESLECFVIVFFNTHKNITFSFQIYGPLQLISCDPTHSFDVVEIG